MGCNSSKSKDIEESKRIRADPVSVSPSRSAGTSGKITQPSQPSIIPSTLEDDFPIATSYTDRHIKETELLKDVIHKTSRKFIDIGQAPLEVATPEHPSLLQTLPARTGESKIEIVLFGLPHHDPSNGLDTVTSIALWEGDIMMEIFVNAHKSLDNLNITNVGDIVVSMC
eukprot:NODE_8821_length_643_cov_28.126923_g8196_i0.p1 GENE.NODE_8821_length_643_cov_28.126923_g8196_i0~~NODE_8821_length_643_cov_28.126923_g8196_i0.p1  ORF type:complete len:170 (-),score=32.80 NODE_8821_length_643_cov_28.126923_g8196_i0:73-582(-)